MDTCLTATRHQAEILSIPDPSTRDRLSLDFFAARPWPHLVLTDLLTPEMLALAYAQESSRASGAQSHRSHRQAKSESSEPFGPAARAILDALDGPDMVEFLREVTGIDDLRSDPTHYWAGLHVNGPGSFHALHRDFTRHPVDGSWHRVNVLVYLNPTWPESYGGRLELWAPNADEPPAVVTPAAPNVVAFAPTVDTIHGLPDPVTCPPGEARLSLNAFYYSDCPPPGATLEPLLRRPRRPQDPWRQGLATWPEIVHGLQHRMPAQLRGLRGRLTRATGVCRR